jgi:hypothetical protein
MKLGYEKSVAAAKTVDTKLLEYGIDAKEITKQSGALLLEGGKLLMSALQTGV